MVRPSLLRPSRVASHPGHSARIDITSAAHKINMPGMKLRVQFAIFFAAVAPALAADLPVASRQFLASHCTECHDTDSRKGGLDLTSLRYDLTQQTNFSEWVLVYDRVSKGEMPPRKKPRPEPAKLAVFLRTLSSSLVAAEQKQFAREGR